MIFFKRTQITMYPWFSLDVPLSSPLPESNASFCVSSTGTCLLFKDHLLLCPFPFLFCPPPLSQDHPAAVLWDLQTVPQLLNRLSKLWTPQAWKKLYTHDNVFHCSKHHISGQHYHYIHKVVIANIVCILTNNGLLKTLGDQEIRDIMCGPLLYRLFIDSH